MPARHSPVRSAGPAGGRSARRRHGCRARTNRRLLARQRAQQPDQQRVLEAVADIAGVEGVAVVHGVPHPALSARGEGEKAPSPCGRGGGGHAPHGRMSAQRPARPRRETQRSAQPSRSRSIPAQATITALSVQSRTGGATSRNPRRGGLAPAPRGSPRSRRRRRRPPAAVPLGASSPSRSPPGRPASRRPRAGS